MLIDGGFDPQRHRNFIDIFGQAAVYHGDGKMAGAGEDVPSVIQSPNVGLSYNPHLPETMSLAAGTRLGSYEIHSAIGAGGMGEVYRARDTRLDRNVAIKILPQAFVADAERVARFQRE